MRPWVIMAQNYSHLLWEVTTMNCGRGETRSVASVMYR